MNKHDLENIHEYLNLERWEAYKEENGIETGQFLYTIPDYRFIRIMDLITLEIGERNSYIRELREENEILLEEVEMLQRNIKALLSKGESYDTAEECITTLFDKIEKERRPLSEIYKDMVRINKEKPTEEQLNILKESLKDE